MQKTLRFVQEYSLPLISGVILAIVWANLNYDSYHWFNETHMLGGFYPFGESHPVTLHFLMNDFFMVLFFGVAAKEITDACLPNGSLNPPSKAINPLLGTMGGIFGPIGVYFAFVYATGNQEIFRGWAIPTATDIALAWLVARLIFGARHPAISFLLLLAVADDAIGLGIIAVFYGDPANPANPVYLILIALGMGLAYFFRVKKVKSYWPYLIGPGILSWSGLFLAHLHPALALVFIVPFMPAAIRKIGESHDHASAEIDTLNDFEHQMKLPVDLGLFGFGLANAGVTFASVGPATWAVFLSLFVGKMLGIFGFSYLGHIAGFKLPQSMKPGELAVAGMIAGIGLTVSLFVAGVAFTDPNLVGSAKMGALLSVFAAPVAFLMGKFLVKKQH